MGLAIFAPYPAQLQAPDDLPHPRHADIERPGQFCDGHSWPLLNESQRFPLARAERRDEQPGRCVYDSSSSLQSERFHVVVVSRLTWLSVSTPYSSITSPRAGRRRFGQAANGQEAESSGTTSAPRAPGPLLVGH
jgi:hypothetical protein